MSKEKVNKKLLMPSEDWSVTDIERSWKVIDKLGQAHGWKGYEPQLEIIGSEQMLDRYSSTGLPNLYAHWSFGKRRIQDEKSYYAGQSGLAYEMIINSNPSVCYLMEDNSACMQLLVLAHAAVGHSHFFKHNYMFKEWTDANSILDYLEYAKNYIRKCEERYGDTEVEELLDHCHNLQLHGIFLYKRKKLSLDKELARLKTADEEAQKDISILDNVRPQVSKLRGSRTFGTGQNLFDQLSQEFMSDNILKAPEENLLYFMEKHSLWLKPWQREIVRIVRTISQYFYPQRQTKVMNEGFASFCHYTLMTEMHEKGLITDGFFLEFLKSHTGVLYQPGAMSKHYSGLNPYTLGFSMFRDIRRIVESPTDEDRTWFPAIAGTKDWEKVINDIVANYNDESFILQFLSPKVIRDLKLFCLDVSEQADDHYLVSHIHDDEDYLEIRRTLSEQYKFTNHVPHLEVVHANVTNHRRLTLAFTRYNDNKLDSDSEWAMESVAYLWGFGLWLLDVDPKGTIIHVYDQLEGFDIYDYKKFEKSFPE